MITIICATHRPRNMTLKVVEKYSELLNELGAASTIMSMDELSRDFLNADTFGKRTEHLTGLMEEKLNGSTHVVVISPEYNGSYPGVFKAFLDALDGGFWKGRKIALVGVATGRAGNLRGMDHLTDVFHHLRAEVFSNKLPISRLDTLVGEDGQLTDSATIDMLRDQAKDFLKF